MRTRRGLWAALAVLVALVVAPSAQAALPTSIFGGEVPCTTEAAKNNIIVCSGKTLTWDGVTKIDVNVILPSTAGTVGAYPTIGDFHGWGGSKLGLTTIEPSPGLTFQQADPRIQPWAENGYAVFSMSDRGWGNSCGKYDSEKASADCIKGYNHLMDDRYEVRDAQYLISALADEGITQPKKIGATGASYGGGISIALAALRNREMLPNGALVPWESPGGKEMEIAAAVPQWPWTDIAYALAPNGRNLDYVTESSYKGPTGTNPFGVMKLTWTEGLYQAGLALSNYNEADPEADIPGWRERLLGGDPYTDSTSTGIIEELTTFHSSFYINHAEEPAALLIQSGWNDDLFPADEALRYYQRTRAQYPSDPISLYFLDDGHARSQNKTADVAAFNARLEAWFAHYLKGEGASPSSTVEALTTTCPKTTASEGPFTASNWSGLQPGEIRFNSAGTQSTTPYAAEKDGEHPTPSGYYFDPIKGPGACASIPEETTPGAVTDSLAPAPAGGFTLMGSPTIIANIESPSPNSEIAARLLDISPSGEESLVARGLYRPTGGTQQMVFQLHPQGYHYAEGHVARLELMPSDMLYGRYSNLQTRVAFSNLELRLPVMEQPGSLGGLVQTPAPKVVPAGYQLAAEFQTKESGSGGGTSGGSTTPSSPVAPIIKIGAGSIAGKLSATRTSLIVPLACAGDGACSGQVSVSVKRAGRKGRTTLARGAYTIAAGGTAKVRLPLTKAGSKLVKSVLASKGPKTLVGQVLLDDSGRPTSLTSKRAVQLPRAH